MADLVEANNLEALMAKCPAHLVTFGDEEEESTITAGSEPSSASSIASKKGSGKSPSFQNRLFIKSKSLPEEDEQVLLTLHEVECEPGSPIDENKLVEACLGDFLRFGRRHKKIRTPRFRKRRSLRGMDFADAVLEC